MLPKREESDDGLCLLEAVDSVWRYHGTYVWGDALRFGDDAAERGIRKWMEILKSFLLVQLKEARQSHDPSMMEVPWSILRMIVSFMDVNFDIVEVKDSGIKAIAQIGS